MGSPVKAKESAVPQSKIRRSSYLRKVLSGLMSSVKMHFEFRIWIREVKKIGAQDPPLF
jgi:hypothetical protein